MERDNMKTKTTPKHEFDEYGELVSPPTLAMAKVVLAQHAMLIRKQEGEYRVAFREDNTKAPKRQLINNGRGGGPKGKLKFKRPPRLIDESKSERCAYYTNDLEDAVDTGITMRKMRTERLMIRVGAGAWIDD
jgi:hypothetical protein